MTTASGKVDAGEQTYMHIPPVDHTLLLSLAWRVQEWIQIAESVPGFEAVVVRCITQIVASATTSRGRSQRLPGGLDQPR